MQKVDYNQKMKQQISQLSGKPKLLLHVCCAPCSSAVLEKLTNHFDITLFYFNPNTYPLSEYNLRAQQFAKLTNLPIIVCDYDHSQFLETVKGYEHNKEGETRCQKCIDLRMLKTFEYAKANNFDMVTTTLSISPHKDHIFINLCGAQLQQKFDIPYLYADFKKENGYLNSIQLSKQFDLYRQDYCGCEFSINKQDK